MTQKERILAFVKTLNREVIHYRDNLPFNESFSWENEEKVFICYLNYDDSGSIEITFYINGELTDPPF